MYRITINGKEIENGLGFGVAYEMAKFLSMREKNVKVHDADSEILSFRNGVEISE